MSSADIAARALEAINAVKVREFDFPSDWTEQVNACAECQSYKGHPIQLGICDTHRRPLYRRDAHDAEELRRLDTRRMEIARDALVEIANGALLQKAEG